MPNHMHLVQVARELKRKLGKSAFLSVPRGDITQLLRRWREGSREAENELFRLVLPNLRRLANYFMKGERKGHTLQPTDLVHEVWLRLMPPADQLLRGGPPGGVQGRGHFMAIAARAMRHRA